MDEWVGEEGGSGWVGGGGVEWGSGRVVVVGGGGEGRGRGKEGGGRGE